MQWQVQFTVTSLSLKEQNTLLSPNMFYIRVRVKAPAVEGQNAFFKMKLTIWLSINEIDVCFFKRKQPMFFLPKTIVCKNGQNFVMRGSGGSSLRFKEEPSKIENLICLLQLKFWNSHYCSLNTLIKNYCNARAIDIFEHFLYTKLGFHKINLFWNILKIS